MFNQRKNQSENGGNKWNKGDFMNAGKKSELQLFGIEQMLKSRLN